MAAITKTQRGGSERWYLRRKAHPNRLLGVDPPEDDIANWRAIWAEAREQGNPGKGGRPRREETALKILRANPTLLRQVLDGTPLVPLGSQPPVHALPFDPDNPHGYEPISPRKAISGLLEREKGRKADGTWDQRRSCLHIQADVLGWDKWDGWLAFWWDWLLENYKNENGRTPHISAANKLIKYGRLKAVRRYIPNFKPPEDRPEQKKEDVLAEKLAESPTESYEMNDMRAMHNVSYVLYGPEHYATLVGAICALAGLSPIDARYMLAGEWKRPLEGFEWEGPDDMVWYRSWRTKTTERIDVPLAPTLARLLEPLRVGEDGIRYRGKSGRGTNGLLPRSAFQYSSTHNTIEAKAMVTKIEGQGLRRYRTGFQVVLENDLKLPESIRKRLMGHKLKKKGDDAIKAYGAARQQETIDAILAYDAIWNADEAWATDPAPASTRASGSRAHR